MIVGNGGHRLRDRVAGAELLSLQHPVDRLVRQRLLDQLAAMAVHDVDRVGAQRFRGRDDVGQHRLAGQRLQHLRQVRLHALALTGRQDDDG